MSSGLAFGDEIQGEYSRYMMFCNEPGHFGAGKRRVPTVAP
jgi:hypothetical protein